MTRPAPGFGLPPVPTQANVVKTATTDPPNYGDWSAPGTVKTFGASLQGVGGVGGVSSLQGVGGIGVSSLQGVGGVVGVAGASLQGVGGVSRIGASMPQSSTAAVTPVSRVALLGAPPAPPGKLLGVNETSSSYGAAVNLEGQKDGFSGDQNDFGAKTGGSRFDAASGVRGVEEQPRRTGYMANISLGGVDSRPFQTLGGVRGALSTGGIGSFVRPGVGVGGSNTAEYGGSNRGDYGGSNSGDYVGSNRGDYVGSNRGDYGGSNRGDYGGSNRGDYGGSNRGDYGGSNRGDYGGGLNDFERNQSRFDENRGGIETNRGDMNRGFDSSRSNVPRSPGFNKSFEAEIGYKAPQEDSWQSGQRVGLQGSGYRQQGDTTMFQRREAMGAGGGNTGYNSITRNVAGSMANLGSNVGVSNSQGATMGGSMVNLGGGMGGSLGHMGGSSNMGGFGEMSRNVEGMGGGIGGPNNMGNAMGQNVGGGVGSGGFENMDRGPGNMGAPSTIGSGDRNTDRAGPMNNTLGGPSSLGGGSGYIVGGTANIGAVPDAMGGPVRNMGGAGINMGGSMVGRSSSIGNMGGADQVGSPAAMGGPVNMGGNTEGSSVGNVSGLGNRGASSLTNTDLRLASLSGHPGGTGGGMARSDGRANIFREAIRGATTNDARSVHRTSHPESWCLTMTVEVTFCLLQWARCPTMTAGAIFYLPPVTELACPERMAGRPA